MSVLRADARALPLADGSVDLVVTSPPYYSLRDYRDGGEVYSGQIGAEPTPAEYVESLVQATREMIRVLKPAGSIWVNLGDKYASSGGHTAPGASTARVGRASLGEISRPERNTSGIPNKSLMGVPWRYALRCIDDLGLILRAEVIWHKTNALPESMTDRVRRTHETWFHLVRQPRHFSAVDEIREDYLDPNVAPSRARVAPMRHRSQMPGRSNAAYTPGWSPNPLGKIPGSVWDVATTPLALPPELGIEHFASFPLEWPRRLIAGWSPSGICLDCGEGRRPLFEEPPLPDVIRPTARKDVAHGVRRLSENSQLRRSGGPRQRFRQANPGAIHGYACDCDSATAPTRPAVVLDPFGGTGTTALVARALGRIGIAVDRSFDYCRAAQWRTTDPGELARAAGVGKPPVVPPDQLGLFEEAL